MIDVDETWQVRFLLESAPLDSPTFEVTKGFLDYLAQRDFTIVSASDKGQGSGFFCEHGWAIGRSSYGSDIDRCCRTLMDVVDRISQDRFHDLLRDVHVEICYTSDIRDVEIFLDSRLLNAAAKLGSPGIHISCETTVE